MFRERKRCVAFQSVDEKLKFAVLRVPGEFYTRIHVNQVHRVDIGECRGREEVAELSVQNDVVVGR